MEKFTVTRMELLARKQQIKLAQEGLELLKQKQTALLQEMMRMADRVLARGDSLEASATAARRALGRAQAVSSRAEVRSAALASRSELSLEIGGANIMGVMVPFIEQRQVARPLFGRGYAPAGVSVTIDEAAEAFETEVHDILALAESELRLKRVAGEIQRTTRRINALEHIVIPRLEHQKKHIKFALEERERAEHFRLKRVKKLRDKKSPLG